MKTGILASCAWPAFWIVMTMTYVHRDMDIRIEPEKFGWGPVLAMACLMIPTAIIAYLGGKHDRD